MFLFYKKKTVLYKISFDFPLEKRIFCGILFQNSQEYLKNKRRME